MALAVVPERPRVELATGSINRACGERHLVRIDPDRHHERPLAGVPSSARDRADRPACGSAKRSRSYEVTPGAPGAPARDTHDESHHPPRAGQVIGWVIPPRLSARSLLSVARARAYAGHRVVHRGPGAVNSRLGSVAKSLTSDR